MRLLALFGRSRGLVILIPAAVAVAVWCWRVPLELTASPLDRMSASLLLALTGLVAGVGAAMAFGVRLDAMERVIPPRRIRELRAAWLVAVVLTLGTAATAGLVLRRLMVPGALGQGDGVLLGTGDLVVRDPTLWLLVLLWRNCLQGVALACASACVVPRAAAWVTPALALALCWMLGTKDLIGTARWWALPCYPPNSAVSWVVTVALFVGVGLAYTRFDARPET